MSKTRSDDSVKLTWDTDWHAVEVDGELLLYGFSSQGYRKTITSDVPSSKILYGFGDHTGLKGAITVTGTLYLLRQLEDRTLELQRHRPQIYDEESQIQQVAIAGNGRVCVSIGISTSNASNVCHLSH